jgi:outer membrane protein assembly factor BamD (BamD/ComL family)
VASGYDPFTGRIKAKPIEAKEIKKTPEQQALEDEIMKLRSQIADCVEQGNLATASQAYLELMKIDSQQILPRQHLLDIANQLMTEGRHADSAGAYEQFLNNYSNYEYAEQVRLMLGILYSRYLERREPAIKYLTIASEKLSDPGQKKMCDDELRRLQG